jgi:hypothetical protein
MDRPHAGVDTETKKDSIMTTRTAASPSSPKFTVIGDNTVTFRAQKPD